MQPAQVAQVAAQPVQVHQLLPIVQAVIRPAPVLQKPLVVQAVIQLVRVLPKQQLVRAVIHPVVAQVKQQLVRVAIHPAQVHPKQQHVPIVAVIVVEDVKAIVPALAILPVYHRVPGLVKVVLYLAAMGVVNFAEWDAYQHVKDLHHVHSALN